MSGVPQAKNDIDQIYKIFKENFLKGDFLKCETILLSALKNDLTEFEKGSCYSNIGTTYLSLGRFDDAFKYYSKIETLNLSQDDRQYLLVSNINNQAIIYERRKNYDKAIEYYEKAIRSLSGSYQKDTVSAVSIASAYHNLGTVYSETGNYKKAIEFFMNSMIIKQKFALKDKEFTYSTLAKCYAGLQDTALAENYFMKSLVTAVKEHGKDYYRLAELYTMYSDYLISRRRYGEAISYYRKALDLCIRTFGEKSTLTSIAFRSMGEMKLKLNEYDSALFFYQKSLISVVKNFNDERIDYNPGIDSSFLEVRLLDNLKGKARVLEAVSSIQKNDDLRIAPLEQSLSTLELAMDLIDIIRNNFPTEESKIYVSEIEKDTYFSAARIASELYSISGNENLPLKMYEYAQRSKASVLRSQILTNALLYSATLPDSTMERHERLNDNIAGYKMLIFQQENSESPDTIRISMWKDEVFEMNRQREQLARQIAISIPGYTELSRKTSPLPLTTIMKNLEKDETIIDYFLSGSSVDGTRDLFIFLINRNGLKFHEVKLDSLFLKYAVLLKNTSDPSLRISENKSGFTDYLKGLFYMHSNLINPVKHDLKGQRLIIIPDEEISWLPFEAFLDRMPESDRTDFDGLHFMLYDYSISHSYSSSLIPAHRKAARETPVFAFSPKYDDQPGFDPLEGANKEIKSVNNIMGGKIFTTPEARRESFMKLLNDSVILHLAMHSVSDSSNSLYSFLLFDKEAGDERSCRLYNYEISLERITTPMIVLSSCNSGAGTLNRSEGLLSIARSFILAGASSVVRTAWEVNDETGSQIITRYYQYLSKGISKDRALQLSKTDFIKNASPAFRDPYYWAAYEVVGDNSPIRRTNKNFVTFVTISVLMVFAGGLYYFRRRRIAEARLL